MNHDHLGLVDAGIIVIERKDDRAKAWEAFDEKARAAEPPYESAAIAQFNAEADAVVKMLESEVPTFTFHRKDLADVLVVALAWPKIEAVLLKIMAAYSVGGHFFRQWYNRFRPIVAKTMAQGGGPTSPVMLAAIQGRVTKLTGNVTSTTKQQIRDVIAKAREDGVGIDELTSRIRSQVFADTITQARAQTIARTETVGALNEGAMLKARQRGVFRSKRWLSQQDGKVRDSHAEAESQGWIAMDARYSNGLDYPHEPGAPADEVINCRCSQSFTDLTADEANGG